MGLDKGSVDMLESFYEDDRNFKLLDTYKSIWIHDLSLNNYKRIQKSRYSYDFVERLIPRRISGLPKVRGFRNLLGHKPQGVDFYRYYEDIISGESRGKWDGEYDSFVEDLKSFEKDLNPESILDISGEPGFFALDAVANGKEVVVTAFADNVTTAISRNLGLETITYDFQKADLAKQLGERKFDVIACRYAIGFCENLSGFLQEAQHILNENGLVYVSFSPASRGVCARWMFDDYTYLRQWDTSFLIQTFLQMGFVELARIDKGSYDWDSGINIFQKRVAGRFVGDLFQGLADSEKLQQNLVVIFQHFDSASV